MKKQDGQWHSLPDSGAAYAAYQKYKDKFAEKIVAIDLSGANIDDKIFKKLIDLYYDM